MKYLALAIALCSCEPQPDWPDQVSQEKMANKLAAEIGAIGLRCLWTEKYGLPRGDCTASLSGNTVHISCSRVCRLYTPTTVVRGGCSVAGVGL